MVKEGTENESNKFFKTKINEDNDINITQVQPAKTNLDLISRNEETQVNALKEHYAQLEKERRTKKNERRIRLCMRFAHVYNPIAALTFVSVYWILGLKEAEYF